MNQITSSTSGDVKYSTLGIGLTIVNGTILFLGQQAPVLCISQIFRRFCLLPINVLSPLVSTYDSFFLFNPEAAKYWECMLLKGTL